MWEIADVIGDVDEVFDLVVRQAEDPVTLQRYGPTASCKLLPLERSRISRPHKIADTVKIVLTINLIVAPCIFVESFLS